MTLTDVLPETTKFFAYLRLPHMSRFHENNMNRGILDISVISSKRD